MKIAWVILILLSSLSLKGEELFMQKNDTADLIILSNKPKIFYDSLEIKASRHRFTKWVYGHVLRSTKVSVNKDLQSYEYYKSFEKKTIGTIRIKSLDVFGPDFNDTAKITDICIESLANKLHSRSSLSVIRKNLWIKEGQSLDPNLLMDNEQLLRSLPYLKDVRIIIKNDPLNDN